MDLTIEGKAYINGSFENCCIGINEGKISSIKKILKSENHINFGKKLILPAGIDIHVHFRDPGHTYKEDFKTGSKASAFGGISCIFDMPNTTPQTNNIRTIIEKKRIAENKCYVDFGVYAAVTNDNIESIVDMSRHCSGFKLFLGNTTNSLNINEKKLSEILKQTALLKKITLFHAENEQCLRRNSAVEFNLKDHFFHRPSECEEISIKHILDSSREKRPNIHICHLSSCEGFELLRRRDNNISIGVTPHHLLFDIENVKSKQTFHKVNPPIRTKFDRETLWYALKNGLIDVLESDHAPHTIEDKETDFDNAPSGMPGVETMYPLFLAEAKKGNISFQRLISLLSEKPAELMNIPKGRIEIGRDADLIVVDIKKVSKIKQDAIHSKCGWTPYEGRSAIFPTHVFVRGEKLIEENEIQVKQGFGKFVGE